MGDILRLIIFFLLLISSLSASAMTWKDFWWRKDQQAMHLLRIGKNEQAAQTFESLPWRAVANYRAKKYGNVEQDLKNSTDPTSKYNLGNALALGGKYQDAIDAYDQAIKQQPNFKDAIYNRDLIKKLLEEQKKNPENKNKTNSEQPKKEPQNKENSNSQQKDNNQSANNNNQNSEANSSNQPQDTNNKPNKQNDPSAQNQQKDSPAKNENSQQRNNSGPGANNPQQNKENDQKNKDQSKTQPKEGKDNPGDNSNPDNKKDSDQKLKQREKLEKLARSKAQQNSQTQAIMYKKLNQETDQWLQQITDDPGDLLRRKIMRDHLTRVNQAE